MAKQVHRIVGKFSSTVGLQLAASLLGPVVYAYKRSNLKELLADQKTKEYRLIELESNLHFFKTLNPQEIASLIIEEADILLPEYEQGSFDSLSVAIKKLIQSGPIQIYYHATWKGQDLVEALERSQIAVDDWIIPTKLEPLQLIEGQHVAQDLGVIVPIVSEKKSPKLINSKRKKVTPQKTTTLPTVIQPKEKNSKINPVKKSTQDQSDLNLEFFYSTPLTKRQKFLQTLQRLINKIIHNF